MDARALLGWVKDIGGFAAVVGLIYQIGRLVEQLKHVTETMAGHITSDDRRFEEHGHQIGGLGERVARLEGGAE